MDEQAQTTGQQELQGFSIVVVGSMNPALHHPLWYQSIGSLSDEEAKAALNADFLFVPQIARFKTAGLEVFCDPVRWQISSAQIDSLERAVKIVCNVFDERLNETPVTVLGLNLHTHAKTTTDDVPRVLGEMLSRLPLGFEARPGSTGKIVLVQQSAAVPPIEKARLRFEIEASTKGAGLVYVSTNFEMAIGGSSVPTKFRLGDLIASHLSEFRAANHRQVGSSVDAVNKVGSEPASKFAGN